jgi:hypothetical protein
MGWDLSLRSYLWLQHVMSAGTGTICCRLDALVASLVEYPVPIFYS